MIRVVSFQSLWMFFLKASVHQQP